MPRERASCTTTAERRASANRGEDALYDLAAPSRTTINRRKFCERERSVTATTLNRCARCSEQARHVLDEKNVRQKHVIGEDARIGA